jgi:hypothetical protein
MITTDKYPVKTLRKLERFEGDYHKCTEWRTHSLLDENYDHLCDNDSWMRDFDLKAFKREIAEDLQEQFGFSGDLIREMESCGMIIVDLDEADVWIECSDDPDAESAKLINKVAPVLESHYYDEYYIEYQTTTQFLWDVDDLYDPDTDEYEIDADTVEYFKGEQLRWCAVDSFNAKNDADIDCDSVFWTQIQSRDAYGVTDCNFRVLR